MVDKRHCVIGNASNKVHEMDGTDSGVLKTLVDQMQEIRHSLSNRIILNHVEATSLLMKGPNGETMELGILEDDCACDGD